MINRIQCAVKERVRNNIPRLGAGKGMRCKARGGVIAGYGDDEQRRSAPFGHETNREIISRTFLSLPPSSEAMDIQTAVEHHRAGRLAEAVRIYERILQA